MKKLFKLVTSLVLAITVLATPAYAESNKEVEVTSAEELINIITSTTTTSYESLVINITDDIKLTDESWVPGFVNGYNGAGTYVINGNNKTISGLTGPLFDGTWAGNNQLIINDLTIAQSNIKGGSDNHGLGAFLGHTEASTKIEFNNCHLLNSTVEGEDWTGGFVGYAAGYAKQDDGPVFSIITVSNCSVKGCDITGKGSTGGIVGHATGNVWTLFEIKNTTVANSTVTCTDDSNIKAGSILGTVGAAGKEYYGKTGGVLVKDSAVSNTTVKSNNENVDRIFGRFGSSDGVLTISGGTYDHERVNSVKPEESVTGTELIISNNVVFSDDPRAVIIDAYLSEKNQRIVVDMGKVRIDESIRLELFSNDTLLTTSYGSQKVIGYNASELTGAILFGDETSSWWSTDEWELYEGLKPTTVKVYIDNEFVGETKVYKTQNTNDYAGKELTDKDWYDFPGTKHVEVIVNKLDATCTKPGYTGDIFCTACDILVEKGTDTPALGHTTEVINKVDATCTKPGYTGDEVCTVCEETIKAGEDIEALGHTYEEGVCSVCGDNEPVVTPDPEVTPIPEKDPIKTGDDANIALFAGLAILAAGSMYVLRRKEEL